MALISLQEVSLGFGGPLLLEEVNLQIERGEWVGLLGRNGMGKSTLLKLVNGDLEPGQRRGGPPAEPARGLSAPGSPAGAGRDGGRDRRQRAGGHAASAGSGTGRAAWQQPAAGGAGHLAHAARSPGAVRRCFRPGLKRRVLLARGLVRNPDLLLLDEPTNHLDIDAIDWLEDFLERWGGTLLFVTHDRVFLQKLATRIVELDRGRLFDWNCDYATFLQRKEAMLAAEQEQNVLFDKKLAQEEQWIRQGIEARRTRNEGRVRALQAPARTPPRAPRTARQGAHADPGRAALRQAGDRGRRGRLCLWRPADRAAIFPPPSSAATRSASSARTARARPPCCAC